MPRHSRRARILIDRTNSPEWHEAMGTAPDPEGFIAKNGVKSWDQLHAVCDRLMRNWESLPERARVGYAFPNPEDRR